MYVDKQYLGLPSDSSFFNTPYDLNAFKLLIIQVYKVVNITSKILTSENG